MQVSRGQPMTLHGCGRGNPEVWRRTDLCKGAGSRKRVGIPEGVVSGFEPEPPVREGGEAPPCRRNQGMEQR